MATPALNGTLIVFISVFYHLLLFLGDTDEILKCTKCNFTCFSQHQLTIHENGHSTDKPYKCNICPKSFGLKQKLLIHRSIHTGEKLFKCTICEKAFTKPSDVYRHKLIHTITTDYFKCNYCPRQFPLKGLLKLHQQLHLNKTNYECNQCDRCFITKRYLIIHKRTDHPVIKEEPTEIQIEQIDDTPITDDLQIDESVAEPEEIQQEIEFPCDLCPKRFTKESFLKQHRHTHFTDSTFSCTICAKTFSREDLLLNHELTHSNPPGFECYICHKHFKTRGYLRTHERIHSGEKPFQCGLCMKCFNQRGSLNRHIKLCHPGVMDPPVIIKIENDPIDIKSEMEEMDESHHSMEIEVYQCNTCAEQFETGDQLIDHQQVHAINQEILVQPTPDKKIECHICARNFTQRTSLKRHLRTVHNFIVQSPAVVLKDANGKFKFFLYYFAA